MEEGFTKREKLVGFFLLLIVIVTKLTFLVILHGKGWWEDYREFKIELDTGYNLQQGSLVKMFNTDIGKVTKMAIIFHKKTRTHDVIADIRVLADYANQIRRDAVAEVVKPLPLFGSPYIVIIPGVGSELSAHATIPLRKGKEITDKLADLFNKENLEQVKTILTNLTLLSSQLQADEKNWNATLKHVDEVMLSLLKSKGTLGELLMRRDFANRMNNTLENMDRVLKEVNEFATGLKPVNKNLEELTKNLNREVGTLRSILADIKAGSPDFPRLMKSATEFSEEGTATVEAIKANPLVRMGLPKAKKGKSLHVEPRHVQ